MPFAAPAGRTIARSGPALAHANLSARQAKDLGLMMSGTSGPLGIGSSTSADLSSSLASKLQTKVRMLGSTLYKLTWKEWVTPSGVSRLRLRASVRRTHAIALSGWPTPLAADARGSAGAGKLELPNIAMLTGWATPCAMEPDQSAETVIARKRRLTETTGIFRGPALPLGTQAQLSGWPTPDAALMNDGADVEKHFARLDRMKAKHNNGNGAGLTLAIAGQLSGWPTPCAQDGPNGGPNQGTDRLPGAAAQVSAIRGRLTDSGEMQTGSTAEILEAHDGGPLTAAHSLWLQGLPAAWERCAYRAMQSMPKSRRRSSKP